MKRILLLVLLISVSACVFDESEEDRTFIRENVIPTDIKPLSSVAYTYNNESGNRLVEGKLDLVNASVVDIDLNGTPEWLLSSPLNNSTIWVAVLDDGNVQGFSLDDNGVATEITVTPNKIHSDLTPILTIEEDGDVVIGNIIEEQTAESSTSSVIQLSSGKRAYIRDNGDLVLVDSEKEQQISLNAMPNTRILVDENERLLLLTDYTNRYSQHVLLKFSTAAGIALVETNPELKLKTKINVSSSDVIEGNSLIWTDLNGDQEKEIITTISNPVVSSHIAVFDEDGNSIANSPSIGIELRWRHQIAVADFGLGQKELVATLFPHLDNEIEFFRFENNNLIIDSEDLTFTSHRSSAAANIDMALAADVDADDAVELLIPTEDFNSLAAVKHQSEGSITSVWQTPVAIGGRLMTNISATQTGDGDLQIGVGNNNNQLRIWY